MRCWLDLDLGSEVMASGFLSCFMIMVTNYFEILQEEKWLGYGPSIQWAKNGEIGQSKKEILVYYIFSGSVLVKKETVQFTVMCSLHLLVFFQNTVLVPMRTCHLSTIVLVICLLPLS